MQYVARKKVAQAAVAMLATHALEQVMAVVAQVVVEQRWTAEVDLLLQDMAAELLRQRRQALVTVTSARAIPNTLLRQLKEVLKEQLAATTVTVDMVIDSTLKGGMVVTTPRGVLEASVAGRLHQLNQL